MRRKIGWLFLTGVLAWGLAGCGNDPQVIANMPGPVQQVLDTSTLSGNNIGTNMLEVTGNQSFVGTGRMPGYYNYGPAEDAGSNTFYVNFEVPVNFQGIARQLGYPPQPVASTSVPTEDYITLNPLPNQAGDRLYYDPNTRMAPFSFKLLPNGAVIDESWDAVSVNS
ncbi:hypothetical protein TPY_0393 [Sulfobacillus acidophilus TPY]|uniref:Lipoprotein n=1 Tax=Sulfobacillus acidophilus (strain ATCC 700253 / DSM 10332 / NAL) TaxID=679936 RepID=G8TY20_SULAD|nr:hypothetical protein TPY_0393 [Sulfobacillus acidophilus TPY]AEW03927.1 hypothetical protein Sulac_0358 [Sulfobacillus acidophilus DSM 10332]